MTPKKILIPLGVLLLLVAAYYSSGWPGLAFAGGGLLLWLLLHFTRLMHVLKRAADTPLGYVGSAVMLQAKLKPGLTLMHVVALTRSLGEQIGEPGGQPELFRWTDASEASVTCEFQQGRLVRWDFRRPTPAEATLTTLPPAP